MQFFRYRYPLYRTCFRLFSSTTEKELQDINQLMKTYNNSHTPIRTYALFQWMLNIANIKPDLTCYLHIIRACSDLNNQNACEKIHRFITEDRTLSNNDYRQLQIKLIYMYAKIQHLDFAEQLFQQIRTMNHPSLDALLYGTMFKGEKAMNGRKNRSSNSLDILLAYNMNRQAKKTIELYENDFQKKKLVELDAVTATCVLNAASNCRRLDIGEHVHQQVQRLNLLDPPNVRLATAVRFILLVNLNHVLFLRRSSICTVIVVLFIVLENYSINFFLQLIMSLIRR